MTFTSVSIRLTDLVAKRVEPISLLRSCLCKRGYALVHVDQAEYQQNIQKGLEEAALLSGFRFPPTDTTASFQYTDAKRHCFRTLMDIGVSTFTALMHDDNNTSNNKDESLPKSLLNAIKEYDNLTLFGKNFDTNEPFKDSSRNPFGYSFFNLFSYDAGMLNTHVDRGLITIIAAKIPDRIDESTDQQQPEQSALWVKAPKNARNGPDWYNIDEEMHYLQKDQNGSCENYDKHFVVILLGEEGEALPLSKEYKLYAAEHAVRVNPNGIFVPHSHHRADPATAQHIPNRLSAAMILRHNLNQS